MQRGLGIAEELQGERSACRWSGGWLPTSGWNGKRRPRRTAFWTV